MTKRRYADAAADIAKMAEAAKSTAPPSPAPVAKRLTPNEAKMAMAQEIMTPLTDLRDALIERGQRPEFGKDDRVVSSGSDRYMWIAFLRIPMGNKEVRIGLLSSSISADATVGGRHFFVTGACMREDGVIDIAARCRVPDDMPIDQEWYYHLVDDLATMLTLPRPAVKEFKGPMVKP